MPRTKTTAPEPSRQKFQRSISDPLYLTRYRYSLNYPNWAEAAAWRTLVKRQQECMLCQEYLISRLLALDWKIEPRDSEQRDELKDEIKYYTRFFEDTGDYEYPEIVEWVGQDYLTIPFGAAAEVGRQGDDPEGKLLWIELLDGGTLYPTLNSDWPYGQRVNGVATEVYFPKHALNRMYMSPRTEIRMRGWGMAPPEKIYLAMQLLSQGDVYYANLLLDTPEAGILDLMDMEKNSAQEWVKGWQSMLGGIDPYKVAVLYEHTSEARFIPFTRNPTDITFNESMARYTAMVVAGYGLAPSDVNLATAGNTLAGSIRDERKTKSNGVSRFKKKLEAWFNRLLPDTLRFRMIDIDDEYAVAIGRARLAGATAAQSLITANVFTEEEMRAQSVADGLITISVPESLPKDLKDRIEQKQQPFGQPFGQNGNGKSPERPSMLGRPVSPSSGGWGETAARSDVFRSQLMQILNKDDQYFQRLLYLAYPAVSMDVKGAITALEDRNQVAVWKSAYDGALWSGVGGDDLSGLIADVTIDQVSKELSGSDWWATIHDSSVLEDCINAASDVYKGFFNSVQKRSFVVGSESVAPTETNFADREEFLQKLSEALTHTKSVIPEILARSAMGTVADLVADDVDNDLEYVVFSQRALSVMKSKLEHALNHVATDFAEFVSDIIVGEIRKEFENVTVSA